MVQAFRFAESLEPPLRGNILNSFLIAATNKNAAIGFLGKKTHLMTIGDLSSDQKPKAEELRW